MRAAAATAAVLLLYSKTHEILHTICVRQTFPSVLFVFFQSAGEHLSAQLEVI